MKFPTAFSFGFYRMLHHRMPDQRDSTNSSRPLQFKVIVGLGTVATQGLELVSIKHRSNRHDETGNR
jgi:hypothetical protein